MEFLLSKRLEHADGLSRLIIKPCEPFEETVIATLRLEIGIKRVLCNTIRELLVIMEESRNKIKTEKYIQRKIIDQQDKKIDEEKIFSICDGILIYGKRMEIPGALKK